MLKKHFGMTILELLLAVAISASLIAISVRLYYRLQFDVTVQKIRQNIDQLFLAGRSYYLVNCKNGTLDPTNSTTYVVPTGSPAANVVTLSSLTTLGFLSNLTSNPLVSSYAIQFVRLPDTNMSVSACVAGTSPPACTITTPIFLDGTAPTITSKVVNWQIQVSVKLARASQAAALRLLLDADSTAITGYDLTWTKLPSDIQTSYSLYSRRLSNVKAFNMLYTNDGMAALSGIKWNDATNNSYNTEYYLCGG